VFGWSIVEQFLAGGHDMDGHFVDSNPRHNLPVLLALTDVWNDAFLGSTGRVVAPFTEAFAAYPAFCAALESQACGGNASSSSSTNIASVFSNNTAHAAAACSSVVIDGGLHHSYDRALYQAGGSRVVPSEVIMTLDTQIATNAGHTIGSHGMDNVHASQDALICSMFAHVDEMALGATTDVSRSFSPSGGSSGPFSFPASGAFHAAVDATPDTGDLSEGNRPSTVLLCGKCDAFTCGQFVALAEHRAVVKARIWDVDPFVREVGSSLRLKRTEALKGELQKMFTNLREGEGTTGGEMEDEEDNGKVDGGPGGGSNSSGMTLSTRTILGHYANLMSDQRIYVLKKS
jgi:glucose-6-phosphate isomerase